jgi:hypothetical protein
MVLMGVTNNKAFLWKPGPWFPNHIKLASAWYKSCHSPDFDCLDMSRGADNTSKEIWDQDRPDHYGHVRQFAEANTYYTLLDF